eukprot:gnl/MRDRNA2_/MRDRNA2_64197_c0_seq1.p1 gnl/MRDRNA2_/MRDRNA2_64197_c0~~gnl/MRDRNA2_/MRDRNA2_64197_c0_seq1.p1  ORF type:complete len:900 (+),score=158.46 gnl/MRDRNA2_/MRDRNA2_64197_c0_seq1:390-2702(+)
MANVVFDKVTSLTLAQTVCAAIYAKETGAGGQEIDLSMLDAGFQFLWPDCHEDLTWTCPAVPQAPPPGRLFRMWDTKDTPGCLALAIHADSDFAALVTALGKAQWATDKRFRTSQDRVINLEALVCTLQADLSTRSLQDTIKLLQDADIPFQLATEHEEVFLDAEIKRRDCLAKGSQLLFGAYQAPKYPSSFSRTPLGPIRSPPPMLGEHTYKVLCESGLTKEDVDALLKSGAAISTKTLLLEKAKADPGMAKKAKIFGIFDTLQSTSTTQFWSQPRLNKGEPVPGAAEACKAKGPLAGVKVLEIGGGMSAAFCCAMLADQGAEVTRVEIGSDQFRSFGPATVKGMGAVHMAVNRGKLSVALNVDEQGLSESTTQLLERLAKGADVIVEDYKPGEVQRKLGISAEKIRSVNTGLIWCSITGYGATGPCTMAPADDIFMQARCGLTTGAPDRNGDPAACEMLMSEKISGIYAAISTSAALFYRLGQGPSRGGQDISTSKFEAMLSYNSPDTFYNCFWAKIKPEPKLPGKTPYFPPLSTVYKLADTKDANQKLVFFCISDKEFTAVMEAFETKEKWMTENPSWKTIMGRLADFPKVMGSVEDAARQYTLLDLAARLEKHEVPYALVKTQEEALSDIQVKTMGLLENSTKTGVGSYRLPRPAARFHESSGTGRFSAPLLGEGMSQALQSLGKYSEAEIADLLSSGAVRSQEKIEKMIATATPKITKRATSINFADITNSPSFRNSPISPLLSSQARTNKQLQRRASSGVTLGI